MARNADLRMTTPLRRDGPKPSGALGPRGLGAASSAGPLGAEGLVLHEVTTHGIGRRRVQVPPTRRVDRVP